MAELLIGAGRGRGGRGRFARSPLIVIWEITRACDLACVHCRASAIPERDSRELTTEEGRRLISEVRRFGRPLFVLTGGDPLKRPDVFELIRAAAGAGLVTNLSPSGTPLLTHAALLEARRSGLAGISISLDGSGETVHDRFRGVPGSFRWSLDGAASAAAIGLRLQINTTLTRHNLDDLPAIADLVGALEARRWTVFLLVPTGRGHSEQQITPEECERAFAWLHGLSRCAPFRIKTTEAPHYRRVALQRSATEASGAAAAPAAERTGSGGGRFVPGMRDGSGFLFISSRGDIQPSGFLPVSAGNARTDSVVRVYREHPLFVSLRDPDRLKGRCGRCEYRAVCGGSRARAYALTGDYLGEDPACPYEPAAGPEEGAGSAPS
ncbi:MAG: TIGR04053 family radical SAM/SPASM domain-containing protein [Acidobacteriota bacterium]